MWAKMGDDIYTFWNSLLSSTAVALQEKSALQQRIKLESLIRFMRMNNSFATKLDNEVASIVATGTSEKIDFSVRKETLAFVSSFEFNSSNLVVDSILFCLQWKSGKDNLAIRQQTMLLVKEKKLASATLLKDIVACLDEDLLQLRSDTLQVLSDYIDSHVLTGGNQICQFI